MDKKRKIFLAGPWAFSRKDIGKNGIFKEPQIVQYEFEK